MWLGMQGLIIGPTGECKTYLACVLAHKACRQGYPALYVRMPWLCWQRKQSIQSPAHATS